MHFRVSIQVQTRKPAVLVYEVEVVGSSSVAKKFAGALKLHSDVSPDSVNQTSTVVRFATQPNCVSLRLSQSRAWVRRVIYDVTNTQPEHLDIEFVQPARKTEAVIADSTNSGEPGESNLSATPQGVAVLDSNQMAALATFLRVVAPDRSVTFEWDVDGCFSIHVAAPRRD